jgi:hypothetical protein
MTFESSVAAIPRCSRRSPYSLSGGFVLDVPYVPGLSISADLYRIEQRDFIDAPTAQTLLIIQGSVLSSAMRSGNLIQSTLHFKTSV